MHKVGIMLMGKPTQSPKKVKEIIIEVEAKTRINDILSYLCQLKRIQDTNVNVAIQKNGRSVGESSTIAQILRHTKPVNNVIKLFLYEMQDQQLPNQLNNSSQKIIFESTKQQKRKERLVAEGRKKQVEKQQERRMLEKTQIKQLDNDKKPGFCCC